MSDPQPMTIEQLSKFKSFRIKKGEARISLMKMVERIENEDTDAEYIPAPKNTLDRINYRFLKGMLETKDSALFLAGFKELHDRLDGKAAQSVTLEDKRSLEELSDAELDAAEQAISAIVAAQNSSAGAG